MLYISKGCKWIVYWSPVFLLAWSPLPIL